MTLNSMPDAGSVRSSGTLGRRLRSNASHLALAAGLAVGLGHSAEAATYTAANETELAQAITDAQASPDASSTITLTGSFSLSGALPAISSKAITIETGANTLSYTTGRVFDVASGASLTISGNIDGTGVLNTGLIGKKGAGELVLDGVTSTDVTRLGVEAGTVVITGGSDITLSTSSGGSLAQLGIAVQAGEVASLTISGAGTRVATAGTDATVLGGSASVEATLTIEDGGEYITDRAVNAHTAAGGGIANLTVRDDGSTLEAGSFGSYNGTTYINVLDGGVVDITGSTSFGGLNANNAYANASVTAVVSGEGSRWDTGGALAMQIGSLSILDGGVVSAATVSIATNTNAVAADFDVLVSGDGSTLSANAITLATRRTGSLTIANDGRVVVNGGNSALTVGGAFADSHATLNIGGAVGQAATAAGTLEASAVTLAASAEINFNHTETDYVFDTPINGDGAINQIAGHTIFDASQAGFYGLTTVYGGTLEVNSTLGGTVDVRGGRLQGTGMVGDTANYAGGVIAPGNSIGTLTVAGDYTSNGGVLEIEAVLGSDNSPTDELYIIGDSVLGTGATQVRVVNLGGAGALTAGDGIRIVQVDGDSAADAFVLAGPAIAGAYRYNLFQNDVTGTQDDGDWYLRTDGLAPTLPTYESYPAVMLGLISLPTLQQRVGDRRPDKAGDTADTALWTRIEGAHSRVKADSSTTEASYDSDLFQLQVGFDGEVLESASGALVAGITAQYSRASAGVSSDLGNGSNTTEGYGIGATLTWYGANGVYVDSQAQVAWFDTDLSADEVGKLVDGNNGTGYALSIEAGREFAVKEGWTVTPQAQLSYASADFDDFVDPFGAEVSLSKGESLKGRIGAALGRDASWQDDQGRAARTHFYGITSLTYEFLDGATVAVSGVDLVAKPQKFGAEFGLGGTYNWGNEKYALHGEALASTSFDGSYAYKGTLGLNIGF
ncbi:autotransporter outer membrane beta-barrel domain-containing protein [Kaistia nematophila]|uniref:Autotransporter outer membrane beta-barrel domain-containing protein n=1 Tax=Kaistia nematophila TaxID=2994654 RepID=A0A9X3E5G5_9HYPH|nr:autotransporter outer membrane beta-barrel domain-containing protein [Kaistia nematophila]MCX5572145.1 autotransporter outer membrane beta-barrel domain-containing protein [Kaistia nematophila]